MIQLNFVIVSLTSFVIEFNALVSHYSCCFFFSRCLLLQSVARRINKIRVSLLITFEGDLLNQLNLMNISSNYFCFLIFLVCVCNLLATLTSISKYLSSVLAISQNTESCKYIDFDGGVLLYTSDVITSLITQCLSMTKKCVQCLQIQVELSKMIIQRRL